jgi:hypothetical protein
MVHERRRERGWPTQKVLSDRNISLAFCSQM